MIVKHGDRVGTLLVPEDQKDREFLQYLAGLFPQNVEVTPQLGGGNGPHD